jgi:PilZ domain
MNASHRNDLIPRGFRRRSASSTIKITCHKKGPIDVGPDITDTVLDLSAAGARLLVSAPLQVGDEIILGLELPYHQRLTRQGRVMWSYQIRKNSYAAGFRFAEHLGGAEMQQATIQAGGGSEVASRN